MENCKKNLILNILIAIASVAVVAVVGRFLTNADSQWFLDLNKPSQFIPPIVFPIVWSVIYVMFAVVIFLLLHNNKMDATLIWMFALNGILQILWSLFYFRLESILGGVIIISILNIVTALLTFKLFKTDKLYGYMFIIYPMWLLIATLANAAIWTLN